MVAGKARAEPLPSDSEVLRVQLPSIWSERTR